MAEERPDGPMFVLDADLNLIGMGPQPCPARTVAVLNLAKPTEVWCGLEAGHDGRHVFHVEWGS